MLRTLITHSNTAPDVFGQSEFLTTFTGLLSDLASQLDDRINKKLEEFSSS